MARYTNDAEAAADGIRILHEPERHRFTLLRGEDRVGEAHYTLRGDADSDLKGDDRGSIDFDHTFVETELRGTGVSGLLAQHALTDPITRGRRIEASCWFIAGYLRKHPELRGGAGR